MSAAFKCDRCGKLYEHGNSEWSGALKYTEHIRTTVAQNSRSKDYDLCPDCNRHLKAFLENPDAEYYNPKSR